MNLSYQANKTSPCFKSEIKKKQKQKQKLRPVMPYKNFEGF